VSAAADDYQPFFAGVVHCRIVADGVLTITAVYIRNNKPGIALLEVGHAGHALQHGKVFVASD
jgi:hypothetical protein